MSKLNTLWNLLRAKLKVSRIDWLYKEELPEDMLNQGPHRPGTLIMHFNGGDTATKRRLEEQIVFYKDAAPVLQKVKDERDEWEKIALSYKKIVENHLARIEKIGQD